jgi:hypothetical protein
MTDRIELYGKTYLQLPESGHTVPLPEGANGYFNKEDRGVVLYHPTRGACAFISELCFPPVSLGRMNGERCYLYNRLPLETEWLTPPCSFNKEAEGAANVIKQVYQ